MPKAKYKRVLLKLSGEAMSGSNGFGIDADTLGNICDYIKKIVDMGVEVAIVVGGGNFWRGRQALKMERTTADYMGMLATIMNGQALQDALEFRGLDTRLQTSIEMSQIAEPYIRRKAVRHLEKGRVVIFAGGTGNPFFSTDTCAALRASEINADIILFGKTIDGVYDSDPKENPNAKKYETITYTEILKNNLKVIDSTAASLCRDNKMPTMIFALKNAEDLVKAVSGDNIGTIINE
ncbi:MAG: UMP kinase [Clostridia bacterium]|nr:UMP kinase [Clostridia bacterium]